MKTIFLSPWFNLSVVYAADDLSVCGGKIVFFFHSAGEVASDTSMQGSRVNYLVVERCTLKMWEAIQNNHQDHPLHNIFMDQEKKAVVDISPFFTAG